MTGVLMVKTLPRREKTTARMCPFPVLVDEVMVEKLHDQLLAMINLLPCGPFLDQVGVVINPTECLRLEYLWAYEQSRGHESDRILSILSYQCKEGESPPPTTPEIHNLPDRSMFGQQGQSSTETDHPGCLEFSESTILARCRTGLHPTGM